MQICKKRYGYDEFIWLWIWTLLPHVPFWILFNSRMYLGDLWCISTFLVVSMHSNLFGHSKYFLFGLFYKCYFFVLFFIELWIILHCGVGMWWPLGLEVSFVPLIFLRACNSLGSLTRIFVYVFLMLFCDICIYTHYCLVYFVMLTF
jgi:hypothetical protein